MIDTKFLIQLRKDISLVLSERKAKNGLNRRREFISNLSERQLEFPEYLKEANARNSSKVLSLYAINEPLHVREKYLSSLLDQNWSKTYPCNGGPCDFYVYAHVDPTLRIVSMPSGCDGSFGGTPFYIGKGAGQRAFDLKRNQGHGKKIGELIDKGWGKEDIVSILFDGLTEQKALEIESKLIYFFGTIYQADRKHTCLMNLDVPKTPKHQGVMEKLMIRKVFEAKAAEA